MENKRTTPATSTSHSFDMGHGKRARNVPREPRKSVRAGAEMNPGPPSLACPFVSPQLNLSLSVSDCPKFDAALWGFTGFTVALVPLN